MANKIILKKSSVTTKVPLETDLVYGELALNYADEKLYFKNAANAIKSFNVVAATPSALTIGTGLSGGSYDGSAPVTIAIDSSVVTLNGVQSLTNKTFSNTVITTNSTTDALRITQVGTGNALIVEDEANPDSTPFVITASGNIGVGTTTPGTINAPGLPQRTIDVVGNDGNPEIRIINTSSTTNRFPTLAMANFGGTTANGCAAINMLRARGDSTSPVKINDQDIVGVLHFWGYHGGNAYSFIGGIQAVAEGNFNSSAEAGMSLRFRTTAERMRVTSAGDVGIGTTTADARLHITNASKTSTTVGANSILRLQSNGSGADVNIQFSDGVAHSAFIGMNSSAVYFSPANTERMRIDSAGNVGIGTASPTDKLHTDSGNVRFSNGNVYIEANSDDANGKIFTLNKSRGTFSAKTSVVNGDHIGSIYGGGYQTTSYRDRAEIGFYVDGEVVGNAVPTAILFRTGTTSRQERFRITSAGNLGIGTTAPAAKLQVDQVGIQTTTTALTTTTQTIVYSYAAATFRTAELMCQIVDSTNSQYHSAKFMIIHNSTDVWFNQTNVIHSHDELGTFTVNISGGNVRLLFTPTAATTKSIKVAAIMLTS